MIYSCISYFYRLLHCLLCSNKISRDAGSHTSSLNKRTQKGDKTTIANSKSCCSTQARPQNLVVNSCELTPPLFVLDGANLVFSLGAALWTTLGLEREHHGRPCLSSRAILLALRQFQLWSDSNNSSFLFYVLAPKVLVEGRVGGICDGFQIPSCSSCNSGDSHNKRKQASKKQENCFPSYKNRQIVDKQDKCQLQQLHQGVQVQKTVSEDIEIVRNGRYRNTLLNSLIKCQQNKVNDYNINGCSGNQCSGIRSSLKLVSRRAGHSYDDDLAVLRAAVHGGGPDKSRGFAVSRDKFRDHARKRFHEIGFGGHNGKNDCKVCHLHTEYV